MPLVNQNIAVRTDGQMYTMPNLASDSQVMQAQIVVHDFKAILHHHGILIYPHQQVKF